MAVVVSLHPPHPPPFPEQTIRAKDDAKGSGTESRSRLELGTGLGSDSSTGSESKPSASRAHIYANGSALPLDTLGSELLEEEAEQERKPVPHERICFPTAAFPPIDFKIDCDTSLFHADASTPPRHVIHPDIRKQLQTDFPFAYCD